MEIPMRAQASTKALLPFALGLILAGGACQGGPPNEDALTAAEETITAEDMAIRVQRLADDEMQGRAPSSPGEALTIAYIRDQFEAVSLVPGVGSSWYQAVPLVSYEVDPNMTLTISGQGRPLRYSYGDDFVGWTTRMVDEVNLEGSELIFVGYGTVAPEYGWNDYDGVDVTGKTVVMLVNDPGFVTEDPEIFNGRAMTYYGRWTYKYEEAARQGAAAVILVHETAPASYPWEVVRNSWTGPQFQMVPPDNNMSRVEFESWVTVEAAREIFARAGMDLEEMKAQAISPDFTAVPMGLQASTMVRNSVSRSQSHNVLGLIPGSERPDEVIIFMAHWDHLGMDPTLEGDQIYNGAVDNATGVVALFELAEAFDALPTPPSRSILFMAVTGEEQGLLGSAHYAQYPIYAPEKTVAAINFDAMNIVGPMRDIFVIGYGNSELDQYLVQAAEAKGRVVKPNERPEAGSFYRSDHFSLAKIGVPALYTGTGNDHVEHGEEWTRTWKQEWNASHYHKPSDEYSDAWNLDGAVDDIRLLFQVAVELAYSSDWPAWSEGTEFKAMRDAMMIAKEQEEE
jgi:Zn-dependent M28 family amino/carboxypeptidase